MPRLKISRSRVITEAFAARREREKVVAEGYRFYAQEASEFAAASLQAFSDVLGHGGQPISAIPNPPVSQFTNLPIQRIE